MKKKLLIIIISLISVSALQAQFLKKLKDKVNNAVNSSIDNATNKTVDKTVKKPLDSALDKTLNGPSNTKTTDNKPTNNSPKVDATNSTDASMPLTVFSKFDFVPGKTVLYFDNFENDNIGETPMNWLTTSSAEVVTIDGVEGKWLKLGSNYARHICRSKKQTWGNNFTVEFDMLLNATSDVRGTYAYINLFNSNGKMVTDENLLSTIGDDMQNTTTLFYRMNILQKDFNGYGHSFALIKNGSKLNSNEGTKPLYTQGKPVHFSFCVQGKRFRCWVNNLKIYDAPAVNETSLPNQLGFYLRDNAETYISNIRIAKDVPDTRAEFNTGKIISNLLFYTGTANLKPESMGALLDISKIIKDASDPVKIVGHTDSDGNDASNLKLSQQRAEAVKTILVKEYGIDETKLTTEGRGETQPIADNKTAEGKAQNRRVEFIFKSDADKYEAPKNISSTSTTNNKSSNNTIKSNTVVNSNTAPGGIVLKSKIINTSLPYAYFMKSDDGGYTLIASKEEGNSKENFIKINIQPVGDKLNTETYFFDEYNKKTKLLYGTKKYPTISGSVAKLFYGNAQKPYVSSFSPYIADGHEATIHLPPPSEKCKVVIEKIVDGKASGHFVLGIIIEGLKPLRVSDTDDQTYTAGYAGEISGTFSNVPIN
ncbi:MAG TPA: OmpA family protein [Chitinophagaceae bacterium]|nr:OmpA family protein [Chitinophagaceae bacterium]